MVARKVPEDRPPGYYKHPDRDSYHISRFDGPLTECNKAKEEFKKVSGDRQARFRDICGECLDSVTIVCEFDE